MSKLHYKGFIGSVELDDDGNSFCGKVLALPKNVMILYEGNTAEELKEDFRGAVDDYLASCKAAGVKPQKSFSGALNIRIKPEVHAAIATLAGEEGISINAFISTTLSERCKNAKVEDLVYE